MKTLISGSSGFIGGYVVEELLQRGHEVIGVDNFSKYGRVAKSYDDHPNYTLVEGDARDADLMTDVPLPRGSESERASPRPAPRRMRRRSATPSA